MLRAGLSRVAIVLAAFATGCAGGPSGPSSPAGSGATLPAVSSCPTPTVSPAEFPGGPAGRVPHPAIAAAPQLVPVTVTGRQVLRFTTAMSLADAAAFVRSSYPAAGFRLTGGDAEKGEADIDWAHTGLIGRTRLSAVNGCSTIWTVLAITARR